MSTRKLKFVSNWNNFCCQYTELNPIIFITCTWLRQIALCTTWYNMPNMIELSIISVTLVCVWFVLYDDKLYIFVTHSIYSDGTCFCCLVYNQLLLLALLSDDPVFCGQSELWQFFVTILNWAPVTTSIMASIPGILLTLHQSKIIETLKSNSILFLMLLSVVI